MIILAMDTSTWSLATAVLKDGEVIAEFNSQLNKNHSLRLMPAIQWVLEQAEVQPAQIEGIAVGKGPGSYTGVRIGVTTAKSMAWALGVPLAGVSSLHFLAQNASGFTGKIIPLIDARRGQVYTGVYRTEENQPIVSREKEDTLVDLLDFLGAEQQAGLPMLFVGEGAVKHRQAIEDLLGDQAVFAANGLARGANLAYLAWQHWQDWAGDTHSLSPEYLQLAEAERNWQQANQ